MRRWRRGLVRRAEGAVILESTHGGPWWRRIFRGFDEVFLFGAMGTGDDGGSRGKEAKVGDETTQVLRASLLFFLWSFVTSHP
jgi:hypothetical protein